MKSKIPKLILTFIVSLVLGIVIFVIFIPELTYIVKLWNSEDLLGIISGGLVVIIGLLLVPFVYLTANPTTPSKYYRGINIYKGVCYALTIVTALLFPALVNFTRCNRNMNDIHYKVEGNYLIYNDESNYPYHRVDLCDWHGNVIIKPEGSNAQYGIATNENGQTILLQGYYTIKHGDSDTYYTYTIIGYDYNSHLPILKATFETIEDRNSELNLNELIEDKLNLIIRPIGSFNFYGREQRLINHDVHVVNKAKDDSTAEENNHHTVKDDDDKIDSKPEPAPTPQPRSHTRAVEKFFPCGGCGGSTYCGVCYGSGWVGNPNNECSSCYGRKICTMCGGRGGTKTIEYVEEYY